MSADLVLVNSRNFYYEAYQAEWKLTNFLIYKNKRLASPPFCPLSKLEVKFCFEIWFSSYQSDNTEMALIKIVLVKLDGSTVPQSMKLELDMSVEYSDGMSLKKHLGLPAIAVNDMDSYYIEDIHEKLWTFQQNKSVSSYTEFGRRMYIKQPILLKCRMRFFDHLGDFPTNCLPSLILLSLKTSENTPDDIKSFKKSDEFCDIIIRGGSRLFLAHKAVLSNHSAVFKQMISHQTEDRGVLAIDASAAAIDSFLDYLYSDELELTSWPKLKDLYVLSGKYEVDTLKKKCSTAVLSHLSVDKVSEILKMACDFEDSSLKEPSIQFAAEHLRNIISSKEWKEFIVCHALVGNEIAIKALNI